MKNIYNKCRFRNGEYAKHLRPFLKRIGNKRWRKNQKKQITDELFDFVRFQKDRKQKRIKIWVKITKNENGRKTSGQTH